MNAMLNNLNQKQWRFSNLIRSILCNDIVFNCNFFIFVKVTHVFSSQLFTIELSSFIGIIMSTKMLQSLYIDLSAQNAE